MRKLRHLTIGFGLGFAAMAMAQPVGYAAKTVKITAGVLITPQASVSEPFNSVPHVWGNVEKAVGLKPAAWTLDNPAGSGTLTAVDQIRWAAPLAAGSRINKDHASYWEVNLSAASDSRLSDYDVLLLPISGTPRLTTSEREKIRRFIDKGGILWIDLVRTTAGVDLANIVPGPFVLQADTAPQALNTFHPLMRTPNRLLSRDLSLIDQYSGLEASSRSLVPGDLFGKPDLFGTALGESQEWDNVAITPSGRTVAVESIGDGYAVLTTRGVSLAANMGVGGALNNNFTALKPSSFDAANSAIKFAINLIELGRNYSASGGGARKDNSVSATVNSPAIKRFVGPSYGFTGPTQVGTPSSSDDRSDTSTPVLFNGRVVSVQNDRVVVYDSEPNRNFDRDFAGNVDDGVQEAVPGSAFDVIWYSQPLGGKLSSPVVVENVNSTAGFVEQVWVRDENSRVYVFNLNSGAANIAPAFTIAPPTGTNPQADLVTPVTIHEGLAYVSDYTTGNLGRVWVIDTKAMSRQPSGAVDWAVQPSTISRPAGAPTVGYIKIDDNSGGNDRVLYQGGGTQGAGGTAPSISSLWLGAKGENPASVSVIGTNLRIATRASERSGGLPLASGAPGSPVAPMVRVIDPGGNFLSGPQIAAVFDSLIVDPGGSRGILECALTALGQTYDWTGGLTPGNAADDYSVRVDYTIDWGGPQRTIPVDSNLFVRGALQLIDQPTPSRRIVGSPALTPNGFLGISVSNTGDLSTTGSGGTFYVLREKGRGGWQVRTRYELHNAISTINVKGGASFAWREAIIDEDNLTTALPFLQGVVRNLRFVGAPAVRNGLFYVTAAGVKTLNGIPFDADTSVLMAFKAEPNAPELVLNAPRNSGNLSNLQLKLRQPDMVKSSNQSAPGISGTLAQNNFSIEPIPGSSKVRVVLDSLGVANSAGLVTCLASNLPVMAEWGNSTEAVIIPEGSTIGAQNAGESRGTFDTLQWYVVFNGYKAWSAPVVTGNVAYVAGTTLLPDVINGTFPPSSDGLLFAMDSDVSPNDPFLVANSVRPWQRQYWAINGSTGPFDFSNVQPGNNLKWPQFNGITDFDDFRIRLMQAVLPGPNLYGMAAGDGAIAASFDSDDPTDLGPKVAVFAQSDFYVVDSGRVARFDPSGNPIWATNQTLFAGLGAPVSAARNVRNLSEPSRFYPDGGNGYVIVDPGNNLLTRVDAAGRELRTVKSVKTHPQFRPDGMTQSETKELRRPNDVIFWTTQPSAAEVAATFPGETILNGATAERWDHWLIADTGNNRVIEVIDRYRLDAAGNVVDLQFYRDDAGDVINGGNRYSAGEGVVIWHTPSQFTGKNFAYSTLNRLVVPDGVGGTKNVFALGFNNVEPGRTSLGLDSAAVTPGNSDNSMGYGGVLLFDGNTSTVITEFNHPAIAANTFYAFNGTDYSLSSPATNQAAKDVKLAGLKSATLKYVNTPAGYRLGVMVSISGGVYELYEDISGPTPVWRVNWMLPDDAFTFMRRPRNAGPFTALQLNNNPIGFNPMYARRLDSGDVLIVNGYSGVLLGGNSLNPYTGEVVLVDGTFSPFTGVTNINFPGFNIGRANLGFNSLSVEFELPPVQGARGIINPIFAERK